MVVLGVIFLVFFIIAAILLILLVLVQNEEGDSLGGIFAGGSASAFGSRSGNVLTKATSILGAIFLVLSLSLALINRSPSDSGVEAAAQQLAPESNGDWWRQNETSGAETDLPPDTLSPGGVEQPENSELDEPAALP
jgi:preprotein translocase subunit SecG